MQTPRLGFVGQLDSFRFFAVSLVIIWHWIPNSFVNKLPNGYLGVIFFFVLSGFLISTNLLFAKQSVAQNKLSDKRALFSFYARRFLRIFPLYYFTLLAVWFLNKNIYEGNMAWYLLYGSNFLVFIKHHWQGVLSHFWSLAVEEQFYLIWPLLILLVRVRYFLPFLFGVISASMLYKIFMSWYFANDYNNTLTIAAFDSFGFGALLAFQKVYGVQSAILNVKNIKYALFFVLIGMLAYILGYQTPIMLIWPYFSVLLIAKALTGYRGVIGYVLNNSMCKYLGRISYGIYVYHNLIPWLTRCVMGTETSYPIAIKPFLSNWRPTTVILLAFEFCVLVAIASFSWYCFEKPINNLKRFFR